MIFDAHVHLIHGDAAATKYSPGTIIETMDGAQIDKSIVFAIGTTTKHSIELAEDAVNMFPDQLVPFAYALPSFERHVLGEIEDAILNRGFRGIKIHAGECRLTEYIVDPVFELASEHGVPCIIDCAGDRSGAERIAAKFPQAKLILAHMGKFWCTDRALIDQFIKLAEEYENVFLEVSGVVLLWKIEDAVRKIGSKRVIFGTDGPHEAPDTVTFARTEIAKINLLNISEGEKKDILGGTIASLLR